jgi:hypothetical protein
MVNVSACPAGRVPTVQVACVAVRVVAGGAVVTAVNVEGSSSMRTTFCASTVLVLASVNVYVTMAPPST